MAIDWLPMHSDPKVLRLLEKIYSIWKSVGIWANQNGCARLVGIQLGQHTLQLLLGDHLHIPHDPPVTSDVITITVE